MKFLSGICATAIVATFAVTTIPAVDAAPVFVPNVPSAHSDVIQIRKNFRRGGNWNGGRGWHNGHRGYRYRHRGYRYHDGFWFPAGAFIAGAVIGGAIANNNAYYGDGYYGRRYYGDPYYGDRYYGRRHYGERYYIEPSYGNRYYRDPFYGNGTRNQYSSGGIPCSTRANDAGMC